MPGTTKHETFPVQRKPPEVPPKTKTRNISGDIMEGITIKDLVQRFSHLIPFRATVVAGNMDYVPTIETGDTLIVHAIKESQVVTITDSQDVKYNVPIHCAAKFGVIGNLDSKEYICTYSATQLMEAGKLPPVVACLADYKGRDDTMSFKQFESLLLKEVSNTSKNYGRVRAAYSITDSRTKYIPEEANIFFSNEPSGTQMYLTEIIEHASHLLPCRARMFLPKEYLHLLRDRANLATYSVVIERKSTDTSLLACRVDGSNGNKTYVEISTSIHLTVALPTESAEIGKQDVAKNKYTPLTKRKDRLSGGLLMMIRQEFEIQGTAEKQTQKPNSPNTTKLSASSKQHPAVNGFPPVIPNSTAKQLQGLSGHSLQEKQTQKPNSPNTTKLSASSKQHPAVNGLPPVGPKSTTKQLQGLSGHSLPANLDTSSPRSPVRHTCVVCEKLIEDNGKGQESIYCEGKCDGWMHRVCAGLSVRVYQFAKSSSIPFLCHYCAHTKEIEELKSKISDLEAKLRQAKLKKPTSTPDTTQDTNTSQNENRFTIIIYGVKECEGGTPRHERTIQDSTKVHEIIHAVHGSLSEYAIRDCMRIGEYGRKKCRPILVKLTRSCDVSTILSNGSRLVSYPGIAIKPVLSKEQQEVESVLLCERRKLINSDVKRKDIRIRGNTLYVNEEKHGTVVNFEYKSVERLKEERTDVKSTSGLTQEALTEERSKIITTVSQDNDKKKSGLSQKLTVSPVTNRQPPPVLPKSHKPTVSPVTNRRPPPVLPKSKPTVSPARNKWPPPVLPKNTGTKQLQGQYSLAKTTSSLAQLQEKGSTHSTDTPLPIFGKRKPVKKNLRTNNFLPS